jgi:hypothetical protein
MGYQTVQWFHFLVSSSVLGYIILLRSDEAGKVVSLISSFKMLHLCNHTAVLRPDHSLSDTMSHGAAHGLQSVSPFALFVWDARHFSSCPTSHPLYAQHTSLFALTKCHNTDRPYPIKYASIAESCLKSKAQQRARYYGSNKRRKFNPLFHQNHSQHWFCNSSDRSKIS